MDRFPLLFVFGNYDALNSLNSLKECQELFMANEMCILATFHFCYLFLISLLMKTSLKLIDC